MNFRVVSEFRFARLGDFATLRDSFSHVPHAKAQRRKEKPQSKKLLALSQSQSQRVELDKPFRVALVVNRVGFEGRNPLVIE